MASRPPLGVVLAGGNGTRLGLGVPKARAPLGARTLLEHAVALAGQVCDEVVVVAPPSIDVGPCPAPRIADAEGGEGPLAGLVAALEVANGRRVCLLGVDLPLVPPELLRDQLARLERASQWNVQVVVPRPLGVPQPLAAAWSGETRVAVARRFARGGRSLRLALAELEVEWIDDEALERLPGGVDRLINVNLPEDLDRARRLLARYGGPPRGDRVATDRPPA
jgi:molybdenum cofactor guanylyltransferase